MTDVPSPEDFPVGEPVIRGLRDVFPILAVEVGDTLNESNVVAVVGTGFRLGPDVLVTCWHCVQDERYVYVLSRGEEESGAVVYPLTDVAPDANGSDLATAKIDEDLSIARRYDYASPTSPRQPSATYGRSVIRSRGRFTATGSGDLRSTLASFAAT